MALVDSQAAFSLHCDKIDGTGWLKATMARNNLKTFLILGLRLAHLRTPALNLSLISFVAQSTTAWT